MSLYISSTKVSGCQAQETQPLDSAEDWTASYRPSQEHFVFFQKLHKFSVRISESVQTPQQGIALLNLTIETWEPLRGGTGSAAKDLNTSDLRAQRAGIT